MSLIEIANKVSKIPGLKKILKPFYYRYKKILDDRRINIFKENGMRVLNDFDQVMTKASYPYFLVFGSMLGAVREHGLIKHDLDLDVAMWYDDSDDNLLPVLERAGFRLDHSFEVDEGRGGREWTLKKDGVCIDIFFVYAPIRKYPYCCDFPHNYEETGCVSWDQLVKKYGGVPPRRIELPFNKNIIRTQFETLQLPILQNSHEILKMRYGKNYMTPIPHWTGRDIETVEHFVVWHDKLAKYTKFL